MRWMAVAIAFVLSASALYSQTSTDTGVIRGRVLAQPSDSAVRNAVVRLESNSGLVATTLSDADGRFVFTTLPSGSYGVSADKPGYVRTAFITGGLPRAESRGQARFTLASGVMAEDVDIRLPKAGAISGRILDTGGDPIVGTSMIAERVGDTEQSRFTTETDDRGEFRIGGLPPGRFILSTALPPGIFEDRLTRIGPAGNIIAGGRLVLRPPPPGTITAPTATWLRTYYPGVDDARQAQPIEVLAAEERAAIDFSVPFSQFGSTHIVLNPDAPARPGALAATISISGRVTRADGRPIPRAQVRAEPIDAAQISIGTVTDDEGRYVINVAAPGRYIVTASKGGYIEVEYGQTRAFERGDALRVDSGQRRAGVDIALPRFGTITGHVLDEYGEPVQGARVQAFRITFQEGRNQLVEARAASKYTDDRGAYRVHDLEPGRYVIRAASGQTDALQPNAGLRDYSPTYFPGTAQAAEARVVTVGISEDVSGFDFPLARLRTATIAGQAATSTGIPIQGGLTLTPSARSGALLGTTVTPRIDADGRFQFSNVAPGEYVIQASMGRQDLESEGEFAALYVAVNGADVTGVVIRTSPGSTVSGRVTFEGDGDPPGPREIGLSTFAADVDLAPRFGTGPLAAGPPARGSVNADSTFELSGLNGPRRLLLADPEPAGWGLKAIDLNGTDITDAAMAFGTADQSLRGVNVVLTNRITQIEGIVRDARGQAARNCSVVVFPGDSARWYVRSRFLGHSSCTRDGAYIVRRLPPGDYFVAAVAGTTDDGSDEWQNPELLEKLRIQAMRIVLLEGEKKPLDLHLLAP